MHGGACEMIKRLSESSYKEHGTCSLKIFLFKALKMAYLPILILLHALMFCNVR